MREALSSGRGGEAGQRIPVTHARMAPISRIGNLLVPNDNYCKFEDWLMPILDQMVLEQNTEVGLEGLGDLHSKSQKTYELIRYSLP